MDKHTRPYRCSDPSCANILGFTYTGGLHRHQREVHGAYGGPKDRLTCPVAGCKRNTDGKRFTRKENLNEHLRRVHKKGPDGTPLQSEEPPNAPREDVTTPLSPPEDSGSRWGVAGPSSASANGKRKRESVFSDRSGATDSDDLRSEIKRLREENAATKAALAAVQEQLTRLAGGVAQSAVKTES